MSDGEREELEALRALMFSSGLGLRPLPAGVLDRLSELEILRHRERPGDDG